MKAKPRVEKEILSILKEFSDAVQKRDVDRVMKLFAKDSDVVSIGSENGETAVGPKEYKAFLRRVLSRRETFSWKWDSHLISSKGEVAWLVADGSVVNKEGDKEWRSPYRLSGVFEKRGHRWMWMQYHGSEPVEKGAR